MRKLRFSKRKTAFGVVQNFPKIEGGDVDENRHFVEGKLVAHGQKFSILSFTRKIAKHQ